MKKLLALAACLALLLSGCGERLLPRGDDITQTVLMRTMGIDAGETDGVKVTMASGLQKASPDGEPMEPLVLEGEGATVYAAASGLQAQGSQDIFYGHVTGCLVGEKFAERGLLGLIDYLERDFDTRLSTKLFILREGEASEAIDALSTEEQSPSDRLDAIVRDHRRLSNGWACSCLELITQLEDNGMALLPALELTEGKLPGERNMEASGFAILREGALAGWLGSGDAAAVDILLGRGGSSAWEVELGDGSLTGLQITNAGVSFSGEWRDGELAGLTVNIRAQASLAQADGVDCPCDEETRAEMEAGLARKLETLCRSILEESQKQGDFLHLRRTLGLKEPWRESALEALDADWLADVEFSVKANCTVTRSYDVGRSLSARREGDPDGTG